MSPVPLPATQAELRRGFWLADLETIRRPKPLLPNRPVKTLSIATRQAVAPESGPGSQAEPLTLDDDVGAEEVEDSPEVEKVSEGKATRDIPLPSREKFSEAEAGLLELDLDDEIVFFVDEEPSLESESESDTGIGLDDRIVFVDEEPSLESESESDSESGLGDRIDFVDEEPSSESESDPEVEPAETIDETPAPRKSRAMAARVRWRDDEGGDLADEEIFWKDDTTLNPHSESKTSKRSTPQKILKREVATTRAKKWVYSPEDPDFPYRLVGPVRDGLTAQDMNEVLGAVKDAIEAKDPRNTGTVTARSKGDATPVKGILRSPTEKNHKVTKKTTPKKTTKRAKPATPTPPRRIMTRSQTKAAANASPSTPRPSLRGGSGSTSTLPRKEPLSFYGPKGTKASSVKYQDRTTHLGRIPSSSPDSSHRLRLPPLLEHFKLEALSHTLDPHTLPPHHTDRETHLQRIFVPDAKKDTNPLIKGLPLMEDIVFLKAGNHKEPGNCFWRCIAYLIYGTPEAWARVKAEHRAHFSEVLRNGGDGTVNPRRGLYEHLNSKFHDTLVTPPGEGEPLSLQLNLYQILHVPFSWVPASMLEVTADVYGVYITLYDVRKDKIQSVKVSGTYNAPHVFVYFDGTHYQPLTPNEYYGWEFQSPRVTREATDKYGGIVPTPRKGGQEVGDGIAHPWRRAEFGTRVPPPVPVDHMWRVGVMKQVAVQAKRLT